MGANSTQALAVTVFLVAFTLMAGSFAAGGSLLLLLVSIALLGVAAAIFRKAKPWENTES